MCNKGASFEDLNEFLAALHQVRLEVNNLHDKVVREHGVKQEI